MFPPRITLKSLGISLFILLLTTAASAQQQAPAPAPADEENNRSIIADEFLKKRPGKSRTGRKSTYREVTPATKRSDQLKLQVGVTIWKFEPATAELSNAERSSSASYWNRGDWIPIRVEADVKFRKDDSLRISIESPRDGYLYVVNRDWLADGTYGETNLIFPTQGEDNQLKAGKLIDIPSQDNPPFKASPNPNQSSELLTIIVTSAPLKLQLGPKAIRVSETQLNEWKQRWGGAADRFEMNGGAGQVRSLAEQLAASSTGARQLTRDDPMPQTIFSVLVKNADGLLFNLVLHYLQ